MVTALVLSMALGAAASGPTALAVTPSLDAEGTVLNLLSVEGATGAAALEAAQVRGVEARLPSAVQAVLAEGERSRCAVDDVACFAGVAREVDAAAILVSVLRPEGDRISLELVLIDATTSRVLRRERRVLPPSAEDIPDAVTQQVALTLNNWRPALPRKAAAEAPPPGTPQVIRVAAVTQPVDGLGLVRGALLWGGGVGLGAGAIMTVLCAGVAAGGYYTFLFGGGVVPAATRNGLYQTAVGASYVTLAAVATAVVGGGALGAGSLFFVLTEEEIAEEGAPATARAHLPVITTP